MSSAAEQEQVPVTSERHSARGFVDIHSVHVFGAFQRDDIRPMLIHFEKIRAVLVEKGEMRGNDHLFRSDRSPLGHGDGPDHFAHLCVLVNVEIAGNGAEEFERMELRLTRKHDRTRHGKRQFDFVLPFGGITDRPQSVDFPFDFGTIPKRIDKRVAFLEIAIHRAREFAIGIERFFIRFEIERRFGLTEAPQHFPIDQTVL